MKHHADLIYDLGLNDGRDTRFYLDKGFRVVAIEANPLLYEEAQSKFSQEIESGRLTILNIGIWSEPSTLPFYINLDNDHWSSFDPAYGCRGGTRFEVVDIPCVRIGDILSEYGVPYYMKIDIEGADRIVLSDMAHLRVQPAFISVEEYGVAALDDLHKIGYTNFHVVPQKGKSKYILPNPPREGIYVEKKFDGYDSGPFGHELPGPWLGYEKARLLYLEKIRRADHTYVGEPEEWHDIHAML